MQSTAKIGEGHKQRALRPARQSVLAKLQFAYASDPTGMQHRRSTGPTLWRERQAETSEFRKAAQNRQSSENAPDRGGFGPKRVIFGHSAEEKRPFFGFRQAARGGARSTAPLGLATRKRLKSYNLAD
ncbi:hypothetical protein ASG35_23385 [Burkholderia sp. Leaf177]|nr:hypothetical protein ASG35_23385 [Burkholderia sp. Leaf177]